MSKTVSQLIADLENAVTEAWPQKNYATVKRTIAALREQLIGDSAVPTVEHNFGDRWYTLPAVIAEHIARLEEQAQVVTKRAGPVPADCDVRKIVVAETDGPTSSGRLVYARNNDDVNKLITSQDERIEELEAQVSKKLTLPANVGGETLADFNEHQWWYGELKSVADAYGNTSQKRAVLALRNLLALVTLTVHAFKATPEQPTPAPAPSAPQYQPGEVVTKKELDLYNRLALLEKVVHELNQLSAAHTLGIATLTERVEDLTR